MTSYWICVSILKIKIYFEILTTTFYLWGRCPERSRAFRNGPTIYAQGYERGSEARWSKGGRGRKRGRQGGRKVAVVGSCDEVAVDFIPLSADDEHSLRCVKDFLVACTRLYNPLCPSVGWLVGWSVTLYFFYDFISLTSLLLPKWSNDLQYGPCPPARDFGNRVSGLVFFHFPMRKLKINQ